MRMVFVSRADACFFFWRVGFRRKPTHVPVLFRPPSWRPSHFSLLAQREVTKRNGTLGSAPSLRDGSLRAAGVLPTVHPWTAAKAARSLAPPALTRGLIRPPFAAAQRDPSQEKIREDTGHGLHRDDESRGFVAAAPRTRAWSDRRLLPSFCGRDGRASLFPGPSRPRRGAEEKARKGRAHDARAFAVEHTEVPSANPGASSRSRRARMPGDRGREGALSLGYFSLGKQREVTGSPWMASEKHTDVSRSSQKADQTCAPNQPRKRTQETVHRDEHHPHPTLPLKGRAEEAMSQPSQSRRASARNQRLARTPKKKPGFRRAFSITQLRIRITNPDSRPSSQCGGCAHGLPWSHWCRSAAIRRSP